MTTLSRLMLSTALIAGLAAPAFAQPATETVQTPAAPHQAVAAQHPASPHAAKAKQRHAATSATPDRATGTESPTAGPAAGTATAPSRSEDASGKATSRTRPDADAAKSGAVSGASGLSASQPASTTEHAN